MFQKNIHARAGERLIQDSEKWLTQDGEQQLAQNSGERLGQDVEQRLSAYYGPALPVYPLPEAAWFCYDIGHMIGNKIVFFFFCLFSLFNKLYP